LGPSAPATGGCERRRERFSGFDFGHFCVDPSAASFARRTTFAPEGGRPVNLNQWYAEVLLAQAAKHRADLLVMRAYSHRRLRELVFGGAARRVLREATLPVLFGS
jgi:hypothetical protein